MGRGARGRRGEASSAAPSILAPLNPNVNTDPDVTDDEEYPGVDKPANKHFCSAESEDAEYLSPLECSDSGGEQGSGSRRSISFDGAVRVSKNLKQGKLGPSPKRKKKQRRRRSSARFLRLSGRFGAEGDENDPQIESKRNENLGEVYRQAIQMNAENKINAGNSWGLQLIENMDKFTYDDQDGSPQEIVRQGGNNEGKRVNFTKASCTLDASVKIYGYRVDDVHLTSYKVLANLSRTDSGGGNKKNSHGDHRDDGIEDGAKPASRKHSSRSGPTETLESNLGEIISGIVFW